MNALLAQRLSVLTLTALLWAGSISAASTVTIGGKSVELPDDIAEEHQKLIDNIGIYDDPELDAYVRGVGERLLRDSGITKPEFSFTLLDSPDINAFALPGGLIYVNRGLLAYLDTEAGFEAEDIDADAVLEEIAMGVRPEGA